MSHRLYPSHVVLVAAVLSLSPAAVFADSFGSADNAFEIEFVTIGDPGNPADTTGNPNPAGAVPYTYRIGKYEISETMIDKANAETADSSDPLDITHHDVGPNKPAIGISWFEAARFVNWLNTSTGATPAYKFDDVGEFQLWEPADAGYDPDNLFRNKQARYFLPSVDEWYKAAYYDPVAGVYYDYPTGSDEVPDGIDFPGDPDFDAVYGEGPSSEFPNDIMDVGVLSPYGTAAQGGNAWEWQETESDLVNDSPLAARSNRGGSWLSNSRHLMSRSRFSGLPEIEINNNSGFRIAAIPEPSTLFVASAVSLLLSLLRIRMP